MKDKIMEKADNITERALDNTFYSVSIYDEYKIIGYGRLIGDNICFMYFYHLGGKYMNWEKNISKLIILRGNSGSGKTTIAKGLQKKFGYGTMLISQDVIRREILYVKDGEKPKVEELLFKLAMYGKQHCNIVIMEGIFNSKWYNHLFKKLSDEFKNNIFAFYFDIPFEETLRRHKTKAIANEFEEKEMREWWNEKDLLRIIPETLLGEELSEDEIINLISKAVESKEFSSE